MCYKQSNIIRHSFEVVVVNASEEHLRTLSMTNMIQRISLDKLVKNHSNLVCLNSYKIVKII